jgi:hypothetical protein
MMNYEAIEVLRKLQTRLEREQLTFPPASLEVTEIQLEIDAIDQACMELSEEYEE